MDYTTPDGKYRIECLSAATFNGALKIIRESFCVDETVCIGTEVNIHPAAIEELLELSADAALDGTSLVAVTTDTGEVAAASFNKLQVAPTGSSEKPFFEIFAEERCKHPSSAALIAWMATLDTKCNVFEIYDTDCSLEIMFLGTAQEHRRNNLGYLLCLKSIELAKKLKDGPVAKITGKDLGPKYAHLGSRKITDRYPKVCQALWTGEGTQKIGKKLNFTVFVRESFDNYQYKGKSFQDRVGREVYAELAAIKIY